MSKKIYNTIYRYSAINTQTIEALCCDKLYFSQANSFNDPFDCAPYIESDSTNETLRKILFTLISTRISEKTRCELGKILFAKNDIKIKSQDIGRKKALDKLKLIQYNATDPEYECSEYDAENYILTCAIRDELLSKYDSSICCFSKSPDNPLLWSHYGDKHFGICAGYDLVRKPKPKLYKVNYGHRSIIHTSLIELAILKNDKNALSKIAKLTLLKKGTSWKYEEELRLIGKQGLQESPLRLVEIVFGMRCSDVLSYMLVSALMTKHRNINFYEIKENTKTFALNKIPLDEDELFRHFPRIATSCEELFGIQEI